MIPITLKLWFLMRTERPIGEPPGSSRLARSGPSTVTVRAAVRSSSEKKRPLAISKRRTERNSGVIPVTVTVALRLPARTVWLVVI